MTTFAAVLFAAVTWYPATNWIERTDPVASPLARRGGMIRFNGGQAPKSLNAYVDNTVYSAMFFGLLYGKLLGMDSATGELTPELARRWSVSDDGRVFTFVLDARATWSDGQPVTADDVKWTFDAVMAPASDTGPWKSMLAVFDSPEVLDAQTVRFRKKGESSRDWRDILNCSSFWILPKHAFDGCDFNTLNLIGAVSGGAYQIVRAEPQLETELRRHGRWWRQDLPNCRGTFNFDRILVRYFAENENAFEAFKKGALDVYPVYIARIFDREARGTAFRHNWILKRCVHNRAPIGFQGFAMNTRRWPFSDRRVRRAMAALVDRETMNRTMMSGAYFLLQSYYEDIYDADHPCANEKVAYNPDAARRLLDEVRCETGKSLDFTFLSRSATEDKFLALFDQELRRLGVKMTIVRKDFASWMRDMDEFAYDMTWAAWGAGVVKYPELAWSGAEADRKGSNNITGFKSAAVDQLIAEEKGMDSSADRLAAYRKMDALIAAEQPYVLLWQSDATRLLHWNKFGMPPTVLSPFEREDSILTYWWYDEDRVSELNWAMKSDGFLPFVPERLKIR